ncbi:MAG: cation diffusion facilitator family transporter [Bacillota bacterium]
MDRKVRVALLSVGSNTILTAGKLATGLAMNSVSVLSEAFHSGTDLLAALIAFVSLRQAAKPADDRHQFGHGKFENIASIIEAFLIVLAAGYILFHAVGKLTHPSPVEALDIGAVVMGISAIVNAGVSHILLNTAKETGSPALAADGWHLRTDVYTSLGVFAGIGAMQITHLTIIDPIAGIAVALLILKAAYELIRDSLYSILDVSLPEEEEEAIRAVLEKFKNDYVEYHALRTRRAGAERHVDLHLVLPSETTVAMGDVLVRRIQEEIEARFPRTSVIIYTEPCSVNCEICKMYCKLTLVNPPEKQISPPRRQERHESRK